MTPQMHALLGAGVLVLNLAVGVWALALARRRTSPGAALTVGAGLALTLLLVQVLAGIDLLTRGHLPPAAGALGILHVAAPFVALLGASYHVFGRARNRVRNYAIAALLTFGLGLVSYAIGELVSAIAT